MITFSSKCPLDWNFSILDATRGKAIVCTTSTAADLKESKFKIENSDLNMCTHLICIDNIWDKYVDPWKPKENQKEDHYKRFTGLRVQHPNLKVQQKRPN